MTTDPKVDCGYSLLAYAHEIPQVSAELKKTVADFQVDEILGFELSGNGSHLCLRIQKTDRTTLEVARSIAQAYKVRMAEIGYAGMKDKRGICTQWFSVPVKAGQKTVPAGIENEATLILDVQSNERKIRLGSHKANAFKIRLHAIQGSEQELRERVAAISNSGVPNYFGYQRFGRNMQNVSAAMQFFSEIEKGKKLERRKTLKKSVLLSSARSFLFNEILSSRVKGNTWDQILPGEVVNLDGTSRNFLPVTQKQVAALEAKDSRVDALNEAMFYQELSQRLATLDIHPTGVLYGIRNPKDKYITSADVEMLEKGVLEKFPELCCGLSKMGVMQSRRALRLVPRELHFRMVGPDTAELEFNLAAGGYATALIRELALTREPGAMATNFSVSSQ